MSQQEKQETIFNSALESLMRLNVLLYKAIQCKARCRENGLNYSWLLKWEDYLYMLFDEISPKMNENRVEKINKDLDKAFKVIVKKRTERGTINVIDARQFKAKWQHLRKIEQHLRRFADQKGMLLPDKPKDDYSSTEV